MFGPEVTGGVGAASVFDAVAKGLVNGWSIESVRRVASVEQPDSHKPLRPIKAKRTTFRPAKCLALLNMYLATPNAEPYLAGSVRDPG